MGAVPLDKFNLNQFYQNTPTVLKYILVISLIVVGSYFFIGKKVTKGQDTQLEKIEQTIQSAYTLIDQFDEFEKSQYLYNQETMTYLKNIYTLVEELNENTNRKFALLLQQGGTNTDQILSQLTLLNESYEKLTEAYTPEPFEKKVVIDPRENRDFEPSVSPVIKLNGIEYVKEEGLNGEVLLIRLNGNGTSADTLKSEKTNW